MKNRDLYSCSVRIPISRSANRCENHLSNIQCMECKKDFVQVQVARSLLSDEDKMKQFQEDIIRRDLEHIKAEDIWVEVCCLQVVMHTIATTMHHMYLNSGC